MAPAYKLSYFDIRGLAEPIRYLLAYGGIEYEDHRIKFDDWSQWKSKTPFGQLPILEHDGKEVAQSVAISRYFAKKVKLTGNDDWEDLEIDSIVDTINDLRLKVAAIFYEQDETKKASLTETVVKETLPYYLQRLEATVTKNNGYFALGRLTWADLYFASIAPLFDWFSKTETLAGYPILKAVKDTVDELPAIKKWIASRPQSDF